MVSRVVVGRARVVREIRAAGPLLAAVRVPVPSREPWLTAVLDAGEVRRPRSRPVAVVVEPDLGDRPGGLARLALRRRGAVTSVTLLGNDVPGPGGGPPARLPARTPEIAGELAAGIVGVLDGIRGPWTLRLAGLPLGDPVLAALAARLPTAAVRTERTLRLGEGLDGFGPALLRTRDPAELERWLPALLAAEPRRRNRLFVRAAARLHAAIGQLELAVVPSGQGARAGLLTLVDGADRWPWWAMPGSAGVSTGMGAPLVVLTARGGPVLGARLLSPRTGAR